MNCEGASLFRSVVGVSPSLLCVLGVCCSSTSRSGRGEYAVGTFLPKAKLLRIRDKKTLVGTSFASPSISQSSLSDEGAWEFLFSRQAWFVTSLLAPGVSLSLSSDNRVRGGGGWVLLSSQLCPPSVVFGGTVNLFAGLVLMVIISVG